MNKEETKFGASEKGLAEFFREGELLPWKKFEFRVVVKFDHIELWPIAFKKPKAG